MQQLAVVTCCTGKITKVDGLGSLDDVPLHFYQQ